MDNEGQPLGQMIEEEPGQFLRLPPLACGVRPFPDQSPKPYLYGSVVATAGRPYLAQGDIELFLAEAPIGYPTVGFWGYGINSYAFYYCSVEQKAKVFICLPYGGAYMSDREKDALIVFFEHFTAFLERVRPLVSSLQLVESMGYSFRRFDLRSGVVVEENEPDLHTHSDHWEQLCTHVNSVGKAVEKRGSEKPIGGRDMPMAKKTPDFRSRMLEHQLAWREEHLGDNMPDRGTWQGKPYATSSRRTAGQGMSGRGWRSLGTVRGGYVPGEPLGLVGRLDSISVCIAVTAAE